MFDRYEPDASDHAEYLYEIEKIIATRWCSEERAIEIWKGMQNEESPSLADESDSSIPF